MTTQASTAAALANWRAVWRAGEENQTPEQCAAWQKIKDAIATADRAEFDARRAADRARATIRANVAALTAPTPEQKNAVEYWRLMGYIK